MRAQWEREQAEEAERWRQIELQRISREHEQQQRTIAREAQLEALRPYENTRDPAKLLDLAWRIQLGHFDLVYTLPESLREAQMNALLSAAGEGEALGFIGAASRVADDAPQFAYVLVGILQRETVTARLERLLEMRKEGHVGATLWLAGWLLGRPVGLGAAPAAIPGEVDARVFALTSLRELGDRNPLAGLPWLVQELSADFAKSGEALPNAQFDKAYWDLMRASEKSSPLRPLAQFSCGVATLNSQARRPDAVYMLKQATGLTTQTDGSSSKPMPIASSLIGRMYLAGGITAFWPREAADAFEQLPSTKRWRYDRALGRLARGLELELGPKDEAKPEQALPFFSEAVSDLARARGRKTDEADGAASIPTDATAEERDAKLWLLASRARFGKTDAIKSKALATLDELVASGDPWARVMRAYAHLQRSEVAPEAWTAAEQDLREVPLFGRELGGSRIMAVLRCIAKLHAHSRRSELENACARINALKPTSALDIGLGELACVYFSHLQPRDIEERSDARWLFEQFVRAGSARASPTMWCRAAALAEVMQASPLSSAEWDQRWLVGFEDFTKNTWQNSAEYRDLVAKWRDLMREPTLEKVREFSSRRFEFVPLDPQDGFESLCASLRLRLAVDAESAEECATQLFVLAREGEWHAQALVADFDAHYKDSYLARLDAVGFHRDAARASEAVAAWRYTGLGFAPPNPARRVHAMTQAILHGSTVHTIEDIRALSDSAPEAVRECLNVLEGMQSSGLTALEVDEIEAASRLVQKECAAKGQHPATVPTRERLRLVATAIGRARGAEAALHYVDSQRGKLPYVDWELGEILTEDLDWLPRDDERAMKAFERAAADETAKPTRAQILAWTECAARRGEMLELERLTPFFRSDEVRALFDATSSAASYGAALFDLGSAWLVIAKNEPNPAFIDVYQARARACFVDATAFGSSDALAALEKDPDLSPSDRGRIGRALIGCSTLNAPLALPWLVRAREGGATGAAEALAPWLAADGSDTYRLKRVQELRDAQAHVDMGTIVYERAHPEHAVERTDLLQQARVHGSPEAEDVLLNQYGLHADVLTEKPKTWAQLLYIAADDGKIANVLEKLPALDAMIAEAEQVHGVDSPERREFSKAIEIVALALAREARAPDGIDSAEFAKTVDASIERALDEGALNVYVMLLDRATSEGDAALMELARRLLDRDLQNAELLDETLRPRLSDTGVFDAFFVERGLYSPNSRRPSALYEFAIAHRRTARVFRSETSDAYDLPGLHRRRTDWRFGSLGALLFDQRTDEDQTTLRAFASIGVEPQDAADLRLTPN